MILEEAASSLCRYYGAADTYPDWPVRLDRDTGTIYLYCLGSKPRKCFETYQGYKVVYLTDIGHNLKQ